MAAVCVHAPTIGALKSALKVVFPAVKSSHLTEAIASALGFRTNAALLAASTTTAPTQAAVLRDAWFVQRLANFGYDAPTGFNFDAIALLPEDPMASALVDINPKSLVAMGLDNPKLYHFCRVLQERGSKLPLFISFPMIAPLLFQNNGKESGYLMINLVDMRRHDDELVIDSESDGQDASEIRADGTFTGIVSFRAEADVDIDGVFSVMETRHGKGWYRKIYRPAGADFSDPTVEILLTSTVTIQALYTAMSVVVDGHVMGETLRALPLAENCLERRYSDAAPDDWADN